jgi:energy-converting hydrogenase Eha subunit F
MTNFTVMMNNTSYEPLKLIDCGTIKTDIFSKVGFTVKLASGIIIALIIFEWWAINKVMSSSEDDERKSFLIGMILTFISGIQLLLSFIIFYWLVLAGLE